MLKQKFKEDKVHVEKEIARRRRVNKNARQARRKNKIRGN